MLSSVTSHKVIVHHDLFAFCFVLVSLARCCILHKLKMHQRQADGSALVVVYTGIWANQSTAQALITDGGITQFPILLTVYMSLWLHYTQVCAGKLWCLYVDNEVWYWRDTGTWLLWTLWWCLGSCLNSVSNYFSVWADVAQKSHLGKKYIHFPHNTTSYIYLLKYICGAALAEGYTVRCLIRTSQQILDRLMWNFIRPCVKALWASHPCSAVICLFLFLCLVGLVPCVPEWRCASMRGVSQLRT